MRRESLSLRYDDFDSFFEVPFHAYPSGSPYVSPLKSDLVRSLDAARNPLFGAEGRGKRHVITAHRGGRPVGRIVAHTHGASNELYRERRACFGYFDCMDDVEVSHALLGAAGLGDIGMHFPDTDPQWRNADSRAFVRHVRELLALKGFTPVNVDVTVLAEAPRLGKHREAMRAHIAEDLGIHASRVNVKATTSEGMGFIGRKEGIAALAVAPVE